MSMTISFFTNKFEKVEIEVKEANTSGLTYPVLNIEGRSGFQQEIITVFPTYEELVELNNKLTEFLDQKEREKSEETNG